MRSILASISTGSTPIFIIALLASATMILDSIVVNIYINIPDEPPPIENAYLFFFFVIIFTLVTFFMLAYAQFGFSQLRRSMNTLKHSFKIMVVCQSLITVTLIIMSVHVLVFRSNDVSLISFVIYLSSITSIGFLIFLNYEFFRWFFSNRNTLILLYSIAFLFVIASLITSTIYLGINLSHLKSTFKLTFIKTQISGYTNYGENLTLVADLYNYLSVISFIALWVPSIYLLKSYATRIGKMRYYGLVAIPVIYFVLPFLASQAGLFDQFISEYDMQFNLVYYYIFSPYKQVGGLLFGLVFWLTASKIKRENLQTLVRIAGLGMILLFGSLVIHGLTYVVSPPFGTVTIGFLPVASYLLLLGIFSSTKELSLDSKIRRELHKTGKQSELLENISKAEVEKTVIKTVQQVIKETSLKEPDVLDIDAFNPDYLEYAKEAMNEVRKIKDKGNIKSEK